jgi:hypothetical protein
MGRLAKAGAPKGKGGCLVTGGPLSNDLMFFDCVDD